MKMIFCCDKMYTAFKHGMIFYDVNINKIRISMTTGSGTISEEHYTVELNYCPFCSQKVVLTK